MALAGGQFGSGIHGLALAPDLPVTVSSRRVANEHVAALPNAVVELAAVPSIVQPLAEPAIGLASNHAERHGIGRAEFVDGVSQLAILGCAVGLDDLPRSEEHT